MNNTCVVILAAGNGKRMKSQQPKVMCQVLFKPMINWVCDSVEKAGINNRCVVIGSGGDTIRKTLGDGCSYAYQQEQFGTGHAASMAADFIRGGSFEQTFVLNGDSPFISPDDLIAAYNIHNTAGNVVTVLSANIANPTGYGRIVRENNKLQAIVEQKDLTLKQADIFEVNSGAYLFQSSFLLDYFDNMNNNNANSEYYLTDCIAYAINKNLSVGAFIAGSNSVLGANDRSALAQLNEIARQNKLDALKQSGVDIPFSDGVVVGQDVQIGTDTLLLPGTIIRGKTTIGSDCEIGPNSYIDTAIIGDSCRIIASFIDRSTLENGVKIGPMSNTRPNCLIKNGAKIGDFVELKNSVIGQKTAVAHLTYVGDTDVGERCNFGCGVVTVNYDGDEKYRTTIGDDVFIGCNTNLIAPVKLGDRVYSAAGTTVTEDVPADSLVIGRAKQYVKINWKKRK